MKNAWNILSILTLALVFGACSSHCGDRATASEGELKAHRPVGGLYETTKP